MLLHGSCLLRSSWAKRLARGLMGREMKRLIFGRENLPSYALFKHIVLPYATKLNRRTINTARGTIKG